MISKIYNITNKEQETEIFEEKEIASVLNDINKAMRLEIHDMEGGSQEVIQKPFVLVLNKSTDFTTFLFVFTVPTMVYNFVRYWEPLFFRQLFH